MKPRKNGMKRAEVKKASRKARRNKILQPQKRQNERERPLAFPFLQLEMPELRSLLRLPYLSLVAILLSVIRLLGRSSVLLCYIALPFQAAVTSAA